MVILVRCADTSVSVALKSKLKSLISDGLITEYLGPKGWVQAQSNRFKVCRVLRPQPRGTTFVSPP